MSGFPRFFKGIKHEKSEISTMTFGQATHLSEPLECYTLTSSITRIYPQKDKLVIPFGNYRIDVVDPIQIEWLTRYMTTSLMDTNADLVNAISDVKEFIGHVASLKRKHDDLSK